jgi:site-specific DNA-methyltransferase (adenine-specific)
MKQTKSKVRVDEFAEVFTNEKEVNAMLDIVGSEAKRIDSTFLEPSCGTGNFLVEILRRKLSNIPTDNQEYWEEQSLIAIGSIYGVDIQPDNINESITRLLKIYLDKYFSIYNYSCKYEFKQKVEYILKHNIVCSNFLSNKQSFNIWFDVIIGNPPYHIISDAGSIMPLYDKFVEKSKRMLPRYLIMIIPARWYADFRLLTDFRISMLNDDRIRILHDFRNPKDCFKGVDVKGGICYFLWCRDKRGTCKVISHYNDKITILDRPLLEKGLDIFIRYNESIPILHKIIEQADKFFSDIISPRDVFNLNTNNDRNSFRNYHKEKHPNDIRIYIYNHRYSEDVNTPFYVSKDYVTTKLDIALYKWKVFVSKASNGSGNIPNMVISTPIIGEPGSCTTATYLMVGNGYDTKEEAMNVISYMKTKFFRFLVNIIKNTQNCYAFVYKFVPMQDFSTSWTDEKLYKKYNLTDQEIEFIESMIMEMK